MRITATVWSGEFKGVRCELAKFAVLAMGAPVLHNYDSRDEASVGRVTSTAVENGQVRVYAEINPGAFAGAFDSGSRYRWWLVPTVHHETGEVYRVRNLFFTLDPADSTLKPITTVHEVAA